MPVFDFSGASDKKTDVQSECTTIPRGVLASICQNPETYKPKFHCRRQSGMNFG